MEEQPNNPLHGKTLAFIIEYLVDFFQGWEGLGKEVRINCFTKDPSVNSSLKFLRKTPWARDEVERLFVKVYTLQNKKNNAS